MSADIEKPKSKPVVVALISRDVNPDCDGIIFRLGLELGIPTNTYLGPLAPNQPSYTNSVIEEIRDDLRSCSILIIVVRMSSEVAATAEWLPQAVSEVKEVNSHARILIYTFLTDGKNVQSLDGEACHAVNTLTDLQTALREQLSILIPI